MQNILLTNMSHIRALTVTTTSNNFSVDCRHHSLQGTAVELKRNQVFRLKSRAHVDSSLWNSARGMAGEKFVVCMSAMQ